MMETAWKAPEWLTLITNNLRGIFYHQHSYLPGIEHVPQSQLFVVNEGVVS